jgi:hypothetical protein
MDHDPTDGTQGDAAERSASARSSQAAERAVKAGDAAIKSSKHVSKKCHNPEERGPILRLGGE